MVDTRTDRPRTTPVPVTTGTRQFWEQSFGKAVGETTTLFGTLPVPHAPEEDLGTVDPDLRRAIGSAAPGTPVARPADPWAALEAAASAAVTVRRAVAADRYVLHRAYPSPRALFGVDLERVDAAGRREVLLPWSGATAPADRRRSPDHAGTPDRRGLVARIRPDRYPTPYAGLRPSLARLEAGHLLATVAAAAHHLGVDPATVLHAHGDEVARLTPRPDPTGPGWTIAPDVIGSLVRASSDGPDGPPPTVDAWFARRTSGPSTANLITSREVPDPARQRIDAVVAAGLAAVAPLYAAGALTVHRTTLVGRGMSERYLTPLRPDGAGPERPMASTGAWASAAGLTWSVDPHRLAAVMGPGALESVHVLLGWLAQWVCLSAAACGIAARPARNFDEPTWAHDLGLDAGAVPAYQVWLRPLADNDLTPAAWTTYGRNT